MLVFIFSLISFFPGTSIQRADPVQHADTLKRAVQRDTTRGKFLQINRIFVVGNRITRDQIVTRELTLKPGDFIYDKELPGILDLDKKKLINTRLFNTVEIRTLELEPYRVDLLIDVNERWYTFPSPIFELSDRNFNEWWHNYNHDLSRVNYGLRLYQFNMRGRNETLRLQAQFGFTRRFNISYRFPYIDKKQKHGLSIDLDFAEAKNMAYQTNDHKLVFLEADKILRIMRTGALNYTYRPSFYESHNFRVEYNSASVDDTVVYLNPNYLGHEKTKQRYTSLQYQFTSDHRDYFGYPLKGYFLQASLTRSGVLDNEDLSLWKTSLNMSAFLDLRQGFYLSNNLIGYASTTNDIPYYNYGAVGYQRQVIRGYEVYVIEGPQFALNKTTFKKRIFSRTYHWKDMPIPQFRHIPLAIYLKTYGDLGYVNNYKNYTISDRFTNKLISGFGAGIDVVGSYDAVLRFEYTYNSAGDRGFFFNIKKEF